MDVRKKSNVQKKRTTNDPLFEGRERAAFGEGIWKKISRASPAYRYISEKQTQWTHTYRKLLILICIDIT
jgi:hypothetical protein